MSKNITLSLKALNAAKPGVVIIDHEQRGLRVKVSKSGFRAFYNARHNNRTQQITVGFIGSGEEDVSINAARERVAQLASDASAYGLTRAVELFNEKALVINNDLTVNQAFEHYAKYQENECEKSTATKTRSFFENHIQEHVGTQSILSKTCTDWLAAEIDKHIDTRRKHAKAIFTTFTAMLKHSKAAKAINANTNIYGHIYKKHGKTMKDGTGLGATPLRIDEMPAFMTWLNGIALDGKFGEVRFALEFMLRTGVRPAEISRVKWDTFLNMELGIWKHWDVKNKVYRTIRIPSAAAKLVQQWRSVLAARALKKGKPLSEWVMPLKNGTNHITESRIGELLSKMRGTEYDSPMYIQPYVMRKTIRTQLSSVLDCPAEIGELILGHKIDESDVQYVYDLDTKRVKMYKFLCRWESVLEDYINGIWEKHDDGLAIKTVMGDYV